MMKYTVLAIVTNGLGNYARQNAVFIYTLYILQGFIYSY